MSKNVEILYLVQTSSCCGNGGECRYAERKERAVFSVPDEVLDGASPFSTESLQLLAPFVRDETFLADPKGRGRQADCGGGCELSFESIERGLGRHSARVVVLHASEAE